jgi:hypothetical protein
MSLIAATSGVWGGCGLFVMSRRGAACRNQERSIANAGGEQHRHIQGSERIDKIRAASHPRGP